MPVRFREEISSVVAYRAEALTAATETIFFPGVNGKTARNARKGGIMSVIQWASFAWKRRISLCATCIWGTVRTGERAKDVETFCRLISPNTVVPFPVGNCTDYSERTALVAEPKPEPRGFGFVSVDALRVSNGETVEVIPLEGSPEKTK